MAEISQHWKQQFWEVIWLVQDHTAILLPNRTNTQVLISGQSAFSPMVVITFPLPPFAFSLLTFCSSVWGQRTSPGPGVPLLKFILLGITDHWDMSVTPFLVFLPIYVVSLLGNMGMVLLICMDHPGPHNHVPLPGQPLSVGCLLFLSYWPKCQMGKGTR